MALGQDGVDDATPMGATVHGGGVVFRTWAPRASAVHVCWDGNWAPGPANALQRGPAGHWTGFVPGVGDGTTYKFWVVGAGSAGFKRDPWARELTPGFPLSCVVRDPSGYPWHDGGFRAPEFSDLTLLQLHVGTWSITGTEGIGTFLDVTARVDHLLALGVDAVQLLPVAEFQTPTSQGYNGTDLHSPEQRYAVHDPVELERFGDVVDGLLGRTGHPALERRWLQGSANQLKVLVDVLHLHGIAVLVDLVLNHAGPGFDDESLYFYDRAVAGNPADSLFFTDQGWAGGLVFAYWNADVRQYLVDVAVRHLTEHHVDGFRYDALSLVVQQSGDGWRFCQDLSATVRFVRPRAVQIAEYWPMDGWVVRPADVGGAGLDASWDSTLRDAVREVVAETSSGGSGPVDLGRVAGALATPAGYDAAWKAVRYVESHDEVLLGRHPRVPVLADGADARSWYARSRSRVASGLVLTSAGIPMLFAGQELLEAAPWSDDVGPDTGRAPWRRLDSGDRVTGDHLRFTSDLLRLRRDLAVLRRGATNVHHVDLAGRVLAVHRWLEGGGQDVVVVASFSDTTYEGYRVGMPWAGTWTERFNSDVYDDWVNPWVTGNGGGVSAGSEGYDGMPASTVLTVPANSLLVLAPG